MLSVRDYNSFSRWSVMCSMARTVSWRSIDAQHRAAKGWGQENSGGEVASAPMGGDAGISCWFGCGRLWQRRGIANSANRWSWPIHVTHEPRPEDVFSLWIHVLGDSPNHDHHSSNHGAPSSRHARAGLDVQRHRVAPELAKGGNGRFCFLFDYPTTWTRKDPDNGDGTWFTDPRIDVQVQATFSGHGGHVDQKPLSEDEASWEEHLNWQPKKWEVLDSRPANGYSLSPSNNDRPVDNLPGWRMTLKSTEGVQDPQMEVRQLLDDDGTHITFTGEAPESVFSEYEPLFAELAASLAGNDDCLGD